MQVFYQTEITAARRRCYLFLVDATDGITPEVGEAAGQPQISINGAGFGNTTNTLVAVGNGSYYVELTVAEVSILGLRDKLTNETSHVARCQDWIDMAIIMVDTYTVKREECIKQEKELHKLINFDNNYLLLNLAVY